MLTYAGVCWSMLQDLAVSLAQREKIMRVRRSDEEGAHDHDSKMQEVCVIYNQRSSWNLERGLQKRHGAHVFGVCGRVR